MAKTPPTRPADGTGPRDDRAAAWKHHRKMVRIGQAMISPASLSSSSTRSPT